MAQTTFAGHPLHPQLVSLPIGLLSFSFVLDVMHLVTRKRSYAEAAYYALVGGSASAVAAASAGAVDYLSIAPDTPVKQSANIHASLNAVLLATSTANLLLRRGKNPPTGIPSVLVSAVSVVTLMVSSWYGGHMVYEHGMRVKTSEAPTDTTDMKLPLDARIEGALAAGERAAPAGGPARGRS